MKPRLTIEAEVAATGGTLLMEVAMALREHRLRPDFLVWTRFKGQDQVTIQAEFATGTDQRLPALLERLRSTPGLRKIELTYSLPLPAPRIELPGDQPSHTDWI